MLCENSNNVLTTKFPDKISLGLTNNMSSKYKSWTASRPKQVSLDQSPDTMQCGKVKKIPISSSNLSLGSSFSGEKSSVAAMKESEMEAVSSKNINRNSVFKDSNLKQLPKCSSVQDDDKENIPPCNCLNGVTSSTFFQQPYTSHDWAYESDDSESDKFKSANDSGIGKDQRSKNNSSKHKRKLFDSSKPTSEVQLETDPVTLKRRAKEINYGKNTEGYKVYTATVPRRHRRSGQPKTPNINQKISRRSWDGQIKSWRRKLHFFDLQSSKADESGVLFDDSLSVTSLSSVSSSNSDELTLIKGSLLSTPHGTQSDIAMNNLPDLGSLELSPVKSDETLNTS